MDNNQVAAIMRGMKPEDIGVAVAVALAWNGNAIFEAMLSALTDANFHAAAAALEKTWKELK